MNLPPSLKNKNELELFHTFTKLLALYQRVKLLRIYIVYRVGRNSKFFVHIVLIFISCLFIYFYKDREIGTAYFWTILSLDGQNLSAPLNKADGSLEIGVHNRFRA